jgi:ketosteroid isomerase-like protein
MNEQQNVDIVRRGYEAFGRGDLDSLLSLFDDNIEWISSGPADLPTAGTRRGREQVREFFNAVNDVFDIQRFEPQTFIAQGDRVVVLGEDSSRVKATGKTIDGQWAHVFTLAGEKVIGFREYVDTAAVMAELHAAHART